MIKLWGIIKGILIHGEVDHTKQLTVDVDPTSTTNTTTALRAKQTADRTIHLPDKTGTLSISSGSSGLIIDDDIENDADIDWGKLDSGNSNSVVITDSLGTLTTEHELSTARGGLEADLSLSTGVVTLDSGSTTVEAQLETDTGGTGQDLSSSTGLLQVSSGTISASDDIDGGTASDTSRITLPKGTTTALDALTDKEGTLAYDTTLGAPVINDGTDWNELGSGTDLSALGDGVIQNDTTTEAAPYLLKNTNPSPGTMTLTTNTSSDVSHTLPVNPTSLIGDSTTATLTNKDYDGGTASDVSGRIALPKATTTALNNLTDKEASLAYDTTLDKVVVNDGSSWNEVGSDTTSDSPAYSSFMDESSRSTVSVGTNIMAGLEDNEIVNIGGFTVSTSSNVDEVVIPEDGTYLVTAGQSAHMDNYDDEARRMNVENRLFYKDGGSGSKVYFGTRGGGYSRGRYESGFDRAAGFALGVVTLSQNDTVGATTGLYRQGTNGLSSVTGQITICKISDGATNAVDVSTLDDGVLQNESNVTEAAPYLLENSNSSPGITTLSLNASADHTLTLPTSTTTLVARDTTDKLTNKDLDGGSATNTSRIILPQGTTTVLDALTDMRGNIAYDTSSDRVVVNDGSVWKNIASSAAVSAPGANLICNGAFNIWNSRSPSDASNLNGSTDDGRLADRWFLETGFSSGTVRIDAATPVESDWANKPFVPSSGLRIRPTHNSLITAVADNNFAYVYQKVLPEENRLVNNDNSTNCSLSFSVKSKTTGSFGISFAAGVHTNSATSSANRTFTISTAETLQDISITDLVIDNPAAGAQLLFWVMQMTTSDGSASSVRTVQGSDVGAGTSSVRVGAEYDTFNVSDDNANYLEIYNVKLELGSTVTEYTYKGGAMASEQAEALQHYESSTMGESVIEDTLTESFIPSASGSVSADGVAGFISYSYKAIIPTVECYISDRTVDQMKTGGASTEFDIDYESESKTNCNIINAESSAVTASSPAFRTFWRAFTGY